MRPKERFPADAVPGMPPRRRAVRAIAAVMAIALIAGCGESTEPTIVNVPTEKVPPKVENTVPAAKKFGPKYGVSPQIDPGAQKG